MHPALAQTMRAEKVHQIKERLDTHLKELAEQMGRGKSEQLVRYLEFSAQFHSYSFGNLMIILFQFPHAARVAGLRKWDRLGRHVRAVQKGIMILAPMSVKPKTETVIPAEPASDGEQVKEKKRTIFKPV